MCMRRFASAKHGDFKWKFSRCADVNPHPAMISSCPCWQPCCCSTNLPHPLSQQRRDVGAHGRVGKASSKDCCAALCTLACRVRRPLLLCRFTLIKRLLPVQRTCKRRRYLPTNQSHPGLQIERKAWHRVAGQSTLNHLCSLKLPAAIHLQPNNCRQLFYIIQLAADRTALQCRHAAILISSLVSVVRAQDAYLASLEALISRAAAAQTIHPERHTTEDGPLRSSLSLASPRSEDQNSLKLLQHQAALLDTAPPAAATQAHGGRLVSDTDLQQAYDVSFHSTAQLSAEAVHSQCTERKVVYDLALEDASNWSGLLAMQVCALHLYSRMHACMRACMPRRALLHVSTHHSAVTAGCGPQSGGLECAPHSEARSQLNHTLWHNAPRYSSIRFHAVRPQVPPQVHQHRSEVLRECPHGSRGAKKGCQRMPMIHRWCSSNVNDG
jgi:hypothetical protein